MSTYCVRCGCDTTLERTDTVFRDPSPFVGKHTSELACVAALQQHLAAERRAHDETRAGAARMREALQPLADAAHKLREDGSDDAFMEALEDVTEETFYAASAALSSTAGADLLREVEVLRELEGLARAYGIHAQLPPGFDTALARVEAARRKEV